MFKELFTESIDDNIKEVLDYVLKEFNITIENTKIDNDYFSIETSKSLKDKDIKKIVSKFKFIKSGEAIENEVYFQL